MEAMRTDDPSDLSEPLRLPEPTHSEDGVDLTLIHWMLSLSYEERLQVLQSNLRSLRGLGVASTRE